MSRIRVLPDALASRIAAGEVVERPASAVKELVENALDAGARTLKVELEDGGKRLVRVTDDGSGMDRDDALLAFEQHATSKVASEDDLAAPSTFGFRGEALAALAACADVTLTTAESDGAGTRVRITDGRLRDVAPAGSPRGTCVEVRSLFSSLPARRKFLRTTATEVGHVLRYLEAQALASPALHLLLAADGRELLALPPAPDLVQRVHQVLGATFVEDALHVEGTQSRVDVTAFLVRSGPGSGRTGAPITLVNGRVVGDRLLLRAFREAAEALFGVGTPATGLLLVRVPPGEVDMNVHPAKREVRFASPGQVHAAVRDVVRREAFQRGLFGPALPDAGRPARLADKGGGVPDAGAGASPRMDWLTPPRGAEAPDMARAGGPRADRAVVDVGSAPWLPGVEEVRAHGCSGASPASRQGAGRRILGQHRNTYILVEDEQGLVLVDQHCAHERVLFERLLAGGGAGGARQALLQPVVVELSAADANRLSERLEDLRALGFDVEEFGRGAFRVSEVPAALGTADPGEMLLEAASHDEQGLHALSRLERMAATTACKAAVKAGFPLPLERMRWLVDALWEARVPTTCPHGRVALLRLSDRDLDHRFGRI